MAGRALLKGIPARGSDISSPAERDQQAAGTAPLLPRHPRRPPATGEAAAEAEDLPATPKSLRQTAGPGRPGGNPRRKPGRGAAPRHLPAEDREREAEGRRDRAEGDRLEERERLEDADEDEARLLEARERLTERQRAELGRLPAGRERIDQLLVSPHRLPNGSFARVIPAPRTSVGR